MPSPRLALTAAACALILALPAAAAAAPPPNDNYLASTSISDTERPLQPEFSDAVDTTEATTQADTFNPNRDGVPFSGGDPEPTSCGTGPSYGKTAWWDFRPQSPGGIEITASAGFDVVVAVYEWSSETSKITRTVTCQNDALGSETVQLPRVRKGTNYTVQVGGANDTGGPLQFRLSYFRDRDGDGVFDALDDCRSQPGIGSSGCPPELRAAPRFGFSRPGNGLIITKLTIDDVPKGARAEVRCRRGCGRKVRARARRAGSISLRRFVGRFVAAGDAIELRVTMKPRGRGRFRHGAIGKYYRYPVTSAGFGKRVLRCLNPGSRKPVKCR